MFSAPNHVGNGWRCHVVVAMGITTFEAQENTVKLSLRTENGFIKY